MPRLTVSNRIVRLWASADDTYEWAHRSGASWPGSSLSGHRLFAEFSRGDLVDYTVDGRSADLESSELNAVTSDLLASRLDPEHPDYDALVTRFQGSNFHKPAKRVVYSASGKSKSARGKSRRADDLLGTMR